MTTAGAILWPLSVIYGAGARLRAWTYRAGIFQQKRLRGVVVSVGNITVGGTGKTPMVAWVARRFVDNGRRVGVLARGYRPLQGVGAVHGAAAGWNGEIALLHARLGRRVHFGVGANRFEKGKELEERGVNGFVLDDGFQHQQLARDVNIVMIDATNPFGGGHLLPSGRLREPISALRRANIIVIHRAEKAPAVEAVIRRYSAAPIFFSQTKLLGVEPFGDAEITVAPARRRKFFAFCGIGNPSSFLADLKRWDISVLGHRIFRDHHRYSPNDIASLSREAVAAGADALLCTEKDTYDLPSTAAMPVPIFFCKIALQFNDEEGLWRTIQELAEKNKGGGA
ncbi:MAG TPA: tetraacyldisaccharide 4'-kinase [Candidatus Acidoferrales bacterium]|nr:tetraacyldisaccharide 4'-kinase [Candidatus Acidoferrales bacterium]